MLTPVFRLFRKPKTKVVLIHREACRLTIDEWRSDPSMTKVAYATLNSPECRAMFDVVKNCGPHNLALPTVPIEERAIWQARIEGYQLCLNTIESLSTLNQPTEKIEPTYEPPENTAETDKE
jgi:hypothetical protein